MTSCIEFPALTSPSFSFWTNIHKFSEINIKPNTLVLCDIDDTLIHHPAINNSWISLINTFFHIKNQTAFILYSKHIAVHEINKYVDEVFNTIPIRHTDRDGFFAMLENVADFAFVTARTSVAKEFTYSNLRSIDVDPEKYPIHFCGNEPKGEYIKRTFDLTKYDHVLFIDDQVRNLENVLLIINHIGLKLYKFEHKLVESPFDYYPLPPGFNPNLRFDGETLIQIDSDNV
jgi:hypothetical protein